ncbi:MAG: hybrid sensor histidine kinase/response regulator [Nitrospinae bacterium]|nr:hybrid sensor histidine kinase/response regulator [Nitrospinota bacterium]
MSHDMRGPLGSVMALLGMLAEKARYNLDEAKQAELVSKSHKSLGGLVDMIDQLLDLSRLQTGRLSVIKRPIAVRDLAISSFGHYATLADKKGIRFVNEVPPGMKVFADGALISEVLNNLVSNAVKFCREGDSVTVGAADPHTIMVKDGGIGIPASILPDLFKPEVKTTTIGTGGEKGTGLGLPYCKEIMVAHGGAVTVESVEGWGAVFSIRFAPVRPVVLVVDDQEVQRAIMRKHILEMKDVEIIEAANGLEALEILKTTEVVLVITDLGMPVMDGFTLLTEIRGNPLLQTLPVIVNSAVSSSTGVSGELIDVRRKVFELGADDFIAKPIVPEDFIPRIIRYLG